jgi:predicted kinase
LLDVDQTRHESSSADGWLGPQVEKEIMLKSYILNHQKALAALSSGQSVILAATYSRPEYHAMLEELSRTTNAPLKIFLLELSEPDTMQRLETRTSQASLSNISSNKSYLEVKNRYQAPPHAAKIEASLPVEQIVRRIAAA